MKRLFTVLFLWAVLLPIGVRAGGVIQLDATGTFIATQNVPDTTSNVVYVEADSVQVAVVYQDGTESLDSTWYNSADAQAVSLNGSLIFYDAWDDLNGSDGVGNYVVTLRWFNGTGSGFDFRETFVVQQTTLSIENSIDTLQAIIDSLNSQDGWVAQEASLFDNTTDSVLVNGNELLTIDVTAYDSDSLGSLGERINTGGDTSLYATVNDVWDEVSISGVTVDSTANSNVRTATDLAETTDDHYNGMAVIFQNGAEAWQARLITDYIAVGGHIVWTPALTLEPVAPTAFRIIPWAEIGNVSALADGSITSSTIATDAIGADEIASNAIGSDELAGGAALEISDTVWDEVLTGATHNILNSAGRRLRELAAANVITSGTAQSGSATSITLAAGTSFADDELNGNQIVLVGGTGVGQTKHIHDWDNITKVALLHGGDNWVTNPDGTTEYEVLPFAGVEVVHMHDSALAGFWNTDTGIVNASTGIGLAIRDTLDAIIDSLQAQDGWVAREASLYDPTTDSVLVDVSAAAAAGGLLAKQTDSIWRRDVSGDTTAGAGFDKAAADFLWRAGDTNNWATLEDVWRNRDTTNVDTSDIGDWFINNIASTGGLDTLSTDFVNRLTGRNADTIWKSLLSARDDVAGSFGDSAKSWKGIAGSGIDSSTVTGAVINALNKDTTISIKQLAIRADTESDTALIVTGADAGPGAYFKGGATNASGLKAEGQGSGSGFHGIGGASSGAGAQFTGDFGMHLSTNGDGNALRATATSATSNPIVFFEASDAGEAFKIQQTGSNDAFEVVHSGNNGKAVFFHSNDTAHTFAISNETPGTGVALHVTSNDGDAALFAAGGSDTTIHNNAIQAEGRVYLHGRDSRDENGLLLATANAGIPLVIQANDNQNAIRVSGNDGSPSAADTVIQVTGGSIHYQYNVAFDSLQADIRASTITDTALMKVMGSNNPDIFYGPSATGTGTDSVVLYLNDTSGTDTPIGDVFVTIKNSVGSKVVTNTSNASTGKLTVHLDAGDYTVESRKTGYVWDSYALTVAGDNDSTEIAGYDIVLTAPSSASLCNVYGYLYDANDNPIVGAIVEGNKLGGVGVDTSSANSKIISGYPVTTTTDTLGLFQLHLYRSTDLADTTVGFYNIIGRYGHQEIFNVKRLHVPNAALFDIGDTILTRGQ